MPIQHCRAILHIDTNIEKLEKIMREFIDTLIKHDTDTIHMMVESNLMQNHQKIMEYVLSRIQNLLENREELTVEALEERELQDEIKSLDCFLDLVQAEITYSFEGNIPGIVSSEKLKEMGNCLWVNIHRIPQQPSLH